MTGNILNEETVLKKSLSGLKHVRDVGNRIGCGGQQGGPSFVSE